MALVTVTVPVTLTVTLTVVVACAGLGPAPTTAPASPITVRHVVRADPPEWMYVVTVDLADRRVSLLLDNATVQSALESIGGYTGLGFDVTPEGVHVYNQFTPEPPTTVPTTAPAGR